jgi:GAF domain-containing protein
VIDVRDPTLNAGSMIDFLQQLTLVSAKLFTDDDFVACGLMFKGHSGETLFCSASPTVSKMYQRISLQHALGEGPASQAPTASDLQVADDTGDPKYPPFFKVPASVGFASILSVPLTIGAEGIAALTFYAQPEAFFTPDRQRVASVFAVQTGNFIETKLRMAQYQDQTVNMRSAMESRTSIDLAIGIIIAQSRCTQEEGFAILRRASNARNVKLRELAENIVAQAGGGTPTTHFTT